jgi:hypothetical protein
MPISKNVLGPTLAVIFLGSLIYIYHFEGNSHSKAPRIKLPKNETNDTLYKRPNTGEIEF